MSTLTALLSSRPMPLSIRRLGTSLFLSAGVREPDTRTLVFSVSQSINDRRKKETYLLPARTLNHLARPPINNTSLEPAPKRAIQHTPQATPHGDRNDPNDLLSPSPATSTPKPRFSAKDLSSNSRVRGAERQEDSGRQSDYEGTCETG